MTRRGVGKLAESDFLRNEGRREINVYLLG